MVHESIYNTRVPSIREPIYITSIKSRHKRGESAIRQPFKIMPVDRGSGPESQSVRPGLSLCATASIAQCKASERKREERKKKKKQDTYTSRNKSCDYNHTIATIMPTTSPKQLPCALLRPDDRSYIDNGFWKRRGEESVVEFAPAISLLENTALEREVSSSRPSLIEGSSCFESISTSDSRVTALSSWTWICWNCACGLLAWAGGYGGEEICDGKIPALSRVSC